MGLQIITGRSGSGKSTYIEDEILALEKKHPTGSPIFYLVPDQMTFQVERRIIRKMGKGSTRIRVLGFNRLAHMILQEQGGHALTHLQQTGVNMLLRKVSEEQKAKLNVFENAIGKNGFIDQLYAMLTECKRYGLEEEQIQSITNKDHLSAALKDKFNDFLLIHQELKKDTEGIRLASEDDFKLAISLVPDSELINSSLIAVDGFHHFSPLEEAFIAELMDQASDMIITLTKDAYQDPSNELDPLHLFFETMLTEQKLIEIAKDKAIEIFEPIHSNQQIRFNSPSIAHLERMSTRRPALELTDHSGVQVYACVNKRAEIRGICRDIKRLVREEKYRYKDIALLTRNLQDYHDIIELIFDEEEIPVFVDAKRTAIHHPLIEFVRSIMEVVSKHWRYEDVIRCLKTHFVLPTKGSMHQDDLDVFENVTLALGINGKQWYDPVEWQKRISFYRTVKEGEADEKVERMQRLYDEMIQPLSDFFEKIKEQTSVREYATSLFELLLTLDAPEKLAAMRDHAEQAGRLQEAKDHDQIWKQLISVLEQADEACGKDDMPFTTFQKMLDTGLESISFSIIPPAFDQVMAATMATSRLNDVKCTFIIGANDGVIPAKAEESTFLTNQERQLLIEEGYELSPSAERQLMNEQFLVYLAQTSPTDRLVISYLLSDDDGKAKQPSMILHQLYDMFPNLKPELKVETPSDAGNDDEEWLFISSPVSARSFMTERLQQWKKGYPIPSFWWSVYNWFSKQQDFHKTVATSLSSIFYTNDPGKLPVDTAKRLYGDQLTASVSRLEQFNSCAFKQFSNYGLRLKDREYFRLEAPDIGILFHEALKELTEALKEEEIPLSELSEVEATRRSKTIIEGLAPKINRNILKSSNRLHYILSKLEKVVIRAAMILAVQAERSGFQPEAIELGFGKNGLLPPLTYTLTDGTVVELSGRIDRVDTAKTENGLYIRVIDYKSSKKDIELDEVYYGLSMQMLVYLDALLTYSSEWLGSTAVPAGMLYFHIHNPLITSSSGKLSPEEAENKILEKFRMNGLILNEDHAVALTDHTLEASSSSVIAPLHRKKDGELTKRSKVIEKEEIQACREWIRSKVKSSSEAILSGNIAIDPYKKNKETPCRFCPYQAFCQFDASQEEMQFRHLQGLNQERAMQLMRINMEEVQDGD
ncbi:helicase-exonuclease AddAB subunit AddB [Salisediminibacterium beveridgei]|uniref:ATP-dependent helicase/deoxyribonuclease subunit B n=1 Tax=Salisediminibacterium beveridgei TaxID=632773 RepID=A0A1D7QVB9_9BACI|nr:helicase-exonuclease AddAB subunit AddB [Salisediminibacterium beveridgei]AOM82964.1 ATP-dependent helicase/deoxyribonuclease subunit B [Salisediminibacterium beveridgei]